MNHNNDSGYDSSYSDGDEGIRSGFDPVQDQGKHLPRRYDSNAFDRIDLNNENLSPLLIDNKEVYYKGFLSLTEEDKAKVLLGFLITTDEDPSLDNLRVTHPGERAEKYKIWKDKEFVGIKKWLTIALSTILLISIVGFVGVFLYFSLKGGVLDSDGLFNGVLTTIQEVFRVLFTSPSEL